MAGFSQLEPTYVFRHRKGKLEAVKYLVAARESQAGVSWELWTIDQTQPMMIGTGSSKKEFVDKIASLKLNPLDIAFARALIKGECKRIKD